MSRAAGPLPLLLALGLQGALFSGSVGAQHVERADSLYFAGEPGAALELLDASAPSYEASWRQARASVALGLIEERASLAAPWYQRGIEYGRRAAAAAPDRPEGRYWLAASLGLHAIVSGSPRTKAEEGEEAYQTARTLLEMAPDHAGGHNVLGRSHFEVRKLPLASRLLGRIFVGGEAIARANWDDARAHLERAVELDPSMIYYRVDLARFYLDRGLRDLARRELTRALSLPAVHPPDHKLHQEARGLLERAR